MWQLGLKCDVAAIGAGVLGVTTACRLSQLYDCSLVLLKKEEDVTIHTTHRNAGLVHRRYHPDPERRGSSTALQKCRVTSAMLSLGLAPELRTG
jgi:L-2-hydroxyglutarate oxidase LhgO